MRVSEGGRLNSALRDLQTTSREMARMEEIVSSGKKLVRPSDDPTGAARATRLSGELRGIEAGERNATLVQGTLDAGDDALQALGGVLTRARELAVQASNGTLTSSDRLGMQAEVESLLQQALDISNRTFDGRSLFGGTATDRAPYRLDVAGGVTTVVYQGDDTARETPVGDTTITVGQPGPGPFATQGGSAGALDALVALRDALASTDPAGNSRAALSGLDQAQNATSIALGDLGGRRAQLDAARDALGARSVLVQQLRSTIEDADLTTAISDLTARQAAYERGMAVIARVLKTNIFEYL